MIRLGNPAVGNAEIEAVTAALREGRLSTGEIVADFEIDCAEFVDRSHAGAVASGSVALELALHTCDLSEGAGVVVSPFNCAAVLYSILREGLVPVFADVNPETYNLDSAGAEAAIEASDDSVEAILAVHLYGQPCEMDEFERVAHDHGLDLIEDFAQAFGSTYRGRQAGSFGDVGVASLGATKNLTTAEGGVVVSDDARRIDRIKSLRSNTNPPIEGELLRSVRMNDLEAAIGREQLAKYHEILDRKRCVAAVYDDRLPPSVGKPSRPDDRTHVYHGYPIRTQDRDGLREHLAEGGIESAAVYDTALYAYPHVVSPADPCESFPETERATEEVLLLPIHASLSTDDARIVADKVTDYYHNR